MSVENGTLLIVKVGTDVIGAAKSHKLNIKRGTEEISTKDDGNFKKYMETDIDWAIDFEALSDPSKTFNRQELIDAMLAGGDLTIAIEPPTPNTGDLLLSGPAIFENYDENAARQSPVALSGAFKGNGTLAKTVSA